MQIDNSIATIQFDRTDITDTKLKELYLKLLKPRLIEEKMLKLLRQGRISKWFSGIGQEAISVGVTSSILPDEFIFTLHRNLGVFTTREIPLFRLFSQWQGKMAGFTKGRDRSFHFGAKEFHIIGMISHLGPQLSLADGIGLAHKNKREPKMVVAFTGEGATSEGEFHEALNLAAVWELPVLFVIENNGYGLSTPVKEQFRCEYLADKGKGYGIDAKTIDGNNVLEVYRTVEQIAHSMREKPAPFLLECMTFRRRGHEEASGTKYVPKELMEFWAQKDPVEQFEAFLLKEQIIDESFVQDSKLNFKREIEEHLNLAEKESYPVPKLDEEKNDLYAHHDPKEVKPDLNSTKELRFVDAISNALDLAMDRFPNLVLMGQDIADYGGVFKVTDGFMKKYGPDRVRNTPLCESAVIGAGLGLSIAGAKAMVEMQFADFVTCGFNQIVNNLAKLHYRWGQNADVVIRMPTGGGVGAGPFHSQSTEAWFTHTPGLKVVYPSNVYDAKGLLLASIDDPNPVLFFEHKALYRSVTANIPTGYYTVEIGKAQLVKEGNKAVVITYGMGVAWAKELVEKENLDVAILDLRTLLPLDYKAIDSIVRQTNKVLILHEDTLFGGIGGEIAAYISEHLFEHLDAPIVRCGSLDTPVPFAGQLEAQFLPKDRLKVQLGKLLAY